MEQKPQGIEDILDKYFRDNRTLYYNASDSFRGVYGESYIRWSYFKGVKSHILIEVGNDDGEVALGVYYNSESLETIIKAIIYQ